MTVPLAPPGSETAAAEAVRADAHALTGGRGDYDALLSLVGDARVVLLGEASHGTRSPAFVGDVQPPPPRQPVEGPAGGRPAEPPAGPGRDMTVIAKTPGGAVRPNVADYAAARGLSAPACGPARMPSPPRDATLRGTKEGR